MLSRSVPRLSKLYKSPTIRSWPIQIRRTAVKKKTIIRDKTCPSRKWLWIDPPWATIMSIISQTWRQKKLSHQKTSLQAPSNHNLRTRTKVAEGGPRVASTKVRTIIVKISSFQTRATISNKSILLRVKTALAASSIKIIILSTKLLEIRITKVTVLSRLKIRVFSTSLSPRWMICRAIVWILQTSTKSSCKVRRKMRTFKSS